MSTASSSIEWTDRTWNPVRGCSPVSPGCKKCYAEKIAGRFSGPGLPFDGFAILKPSGYRWTGKVELIEHALTEPLHWKKPQRIFVNSMSDLFHESLPDEVIDRVFAVMHEAYWHTFQVLTKRAERLRKYFGDETDDNRWHKISDQMAKYGGRGLGPYRWVHIGVSVENRKHKDRIDFLRRTTADVRFLSLEPLLEDIGELDLTDIHWVIVGGESGPHARPFDTEWARRVVDQCRLANVPCFIKQLGSNPFGPDEPKVFTRDRKGGDWSNWPECLKVRQFPGDLQAARTDSTTHPGGNA